MLSRVVEILRKYFASDCSQLFELENHSHQQIPLMVVNNTRIFVLKIPPNEIEITVA